MPTITLNLTTLQHLAEFVSVYLGASPTLSEIEEYVRRKFEEKDIYKSYEQGLITEEEICSFVSAHVYTRFAQHHADFFDVDAEKVSASNRRLQESLFES